MNTPRCCSVFLGSGRYLPQILLPTLVVTRPRSALLTGSLAWQGSPQHRVIPGVSAGTFTDPKRYNRRLLRTCFLAALSSLKNSTASRTFYDRKRSEGKTHKQALIALARRRINVIWALLRDHTTYQEPAPKKA